MEDLKGRDPDAAFPNAISDMPLTFGFFIPNAADQLPLRIFAFVRHLPLAICLPGTNATFKQPPQLVALLPL